MTPVISLRYRGTAEQRAAIEAELDALVDDFDAESFVATRRAEAMTIDMLEADIGETVVNSLARALVAKAGADPITALRLARHNAGLLIECLTDLAARHM